MWRLLVYVSGFPFGVLATLQNRDHDLVISVSPQHATVLALHHILVNGCQLSAAAKQTTPKFVA